MYFKSYRSPYFYNRLCMTRYFPLCVKLSCDLILEVCKLILHVSELRSLYIAVSLGPLDLLRKHRFFAPCLLPNKKWSLSCGFIYILLNGCMSKRWSYTLCYNILVSERCCTVVRVIKSYLKVIITGEDKRKRITSLIVSFPRDNKFKAK